MTFSATNDREALSGMLRRTHKAFSQTDRTITVSTDSGKNLIFTFDKNESLKHTKVSRSTELDDAGFVRNIDFKDFEFGDILEEELRNKLTGSNYLLNFGENGLASIVGVPGSKQSRCLRVDFERDQYGPGSGVKFLLPIPRSNEYYYEYNLYLSPKFSFSEGGYLPGLGSGFVADPDHPERSIPEWWSRVVWKNANGDVHVFRHPNLRLTLRKADNVTPYRFTKGKWHRIKSYVKLNSTPGSSDGRLIVWLDGELIFDDGFRHLTSKPELGLEWFFCENQYLRIGWGTGPSNDKSYLLIRNIRISNKPI